MTEEGAESVVLFSSGSQHSPGHHQAHMRAVWSPSSLRQARDLAHCYLFPHRWALGCQCRVLGTQGPISVCVLLFKAPRPSRLLPAPLSPYLISVFSRGTHRASWTWKPHRTLKPISASWALWAFLTLESTEKPWSAEASWEHPSSVSPLREGLWAGSWASAWRTEGQLCPGLGRAHAPLRLTHTH